jgi:hypothetical protein
MVKYAITVVFKGVVTEEAETIYYINKDGNFVFLDDLEGEDIYDYYNDARKAAIKYHKELNSPTQVVELHAE